VTERRSAEMNRTDSVRNMMQGVFSFPNPVNDKAARTVAGVVLATVIVILLTGSYWLLVPLAYGFWARVLTGPTLSPLAWTAMNVIAPRLGEPQPVPGPPKRFAQAMGAVMSTAALILGVVLGDHTAADVVLIGFLAAAGLAVAQVRFIALGAIDGRCVDDSGVGREFGTESFDDHFNTKSVMVATHDQPFDWYRDTATQRRLN